MSHNIGLKQPLKVIPGDGELAGIYEGTAIIGLMQTGVVVTVAVTRGMGIVMDPTAILQAENFGTGNSALAISANILRCRPSHSTTYNTGWLGIALQDAAIGEECAIASYGSIAYGLVAASTGTLGQHANATTSNGTLVSAATSPAMPANSLGFFLKPSGAASPTGGSTDTGSNNRAALIVMPHGVTA